MKAYLVEDEIIARDYLAKMLTDNFADIEIVGMAGSVEASVEWLRNPANHADVIFMDVELSDGKCFEIFQEVDVEAHVVMTTAYDNYAVKSFEVNSIDYLLKPIKLEDLRRAVERCRKRDGLGGVSADVSKLLASLGGAKSDQYKERMLVSINNRIVPVRTSDVAFFFSEDKVNYVVLFDGSSYVVDSSLDAIAAMLNPEGFFRASRSCIVAKDAVSSVTKLLGSRLRINVKELGGNGAAMGIAAPDLTVSRSRTEDFLLWLQR